MDQAARKTRFTLTEHIQAGQVLKEAVDALVQIQLRYALRSPTAKLASQVEDQLLQLRWMLTDEVQLMLPRKKAIQVYGMPRRKRTRRRADQDVTYW